MRPRRIYRLLAALCVAGVALTLHPIPSSATFPGANGRLAFARWVSPTRQDVYTVRADGTGERLAIRYAEHPAWSPDGTRIAFERWGTDGFKHIYVKDMLTGRISQITSSQRDDTSPAWSPDGTKIAFIADSYRPREGIYYISSTRPFGKRQLVFALPVSTHASDPEWSPNGWRIAFAYYVDGVGDRIAVQRVGRPGSDPVLLTSGWLDQFPTWSPTGKKIAYSDVFGNLSIVNADGTGQRHFATGLSIYDLAWSPDGRMVAAIIDYEYSTEIITLNPWTGGWIDSEVAWDVHGVDWQAIPR